jgi:hypothetical protein
MKKRILLSAALMLGTPDIHAVDTSEGVHDEETEPQASEADAAHDFNGVSLALGVDFSRSGVNGRLGEARTEKNIPIGTGIVVKNLGAAGIAMGAAAINAETLSGLNADLAGLGIRATHSDGSPLVVGDFHIPNAAPFAAIAQGGGGGVVLVHNPNGIKLIKTENGKNWDKKQTRVGGAIGLGVGHVYCGKFYSGLDLGFNFGQKVEEQGTQRSGTQPNAAIRLGYVGRPGCRPTLFYARVGGTHVSVEDVGTSRKDKYLALLLGAGFETAFGKGICGKVEVSWTQGKTFNQNVNGIDTSIPVGAIGAAGAGRNGAFGIPIDMRCAVGRETKSKDSFNVGVSVVLRPGAVKHWN